LSEYQHYCLFGEPWWLDVTAGPGAWDEVRIESGGKLLARLPYTLTKNRSGITTLGMPPLTQSLGPWFNLDPSKYASNLARQKDLVDQLIKRLPSHDIFRQNFHPSLTNWLPWYWQGYQQTTRYSYAIKDLSDERIIWDGMQSNIRSDIRKAKNRFGLQVRSDLGVDVLIEVCQKTFDRQDEEGLSEVIVRRMYDTCENRNSGKPFFAVDDSGKVHAVAYLIWDERTAYYIIGGGDPELRNSGAHSLLMWEAIQFASTVSKVFDFEGSMIESIERHFRNFGATQVPYHRISRTTNQNLQAKACLREALKYAKCGARAFLRRSKSA
jgi:hypothetical protein